MNIRDKEIFRDLFICPETHEPLKIIDDCLVSESGRSWPIVNDIPRFIGGDQYADNFSFEWLMHPETQLDFATGTSISADMLTEKTGLTSKQVRGKLVFDAGVGAGRYSDVLSKWGANVVGVDLSYAVETAQTNLGERENVVITQADIGKLPFREATFDYIISIGVLHHTPDTQHYFNKLVPLLKPGGEICIWVYPDYGDYAKRAHWIPFTCRIPRKWYYTWCRFFIPLTKKNPQSSLIRLIYSVFPYSNQSFGLENDILDTFDGFSSRYHGVHNPDEVIGWFKNAGLTNIKNFSFNTAVRGQKPSG